jgi:4-hydroxy-tetrahydrodipicolinate synthase
MIRGIVPVMLTPFDTDNRVDLGSLERLTEWYLRHGADALFAVCQSSEMQHLSLQERVQLARTVVAQTANRVPVIASGHIAESLEDQITELSAIAKTGIDGLVLVTNRLDPKHRGFDAFNHNLKAILTALPGDLPLGLYECPAPFRRLLSDEELKLCRDTGRFVVLKDVSCDLETIKRRLQLTKSTDFAVINANAAIAHASMRAGSQGFAGVFTNFHPDLYAWLYRNRDLGDLLVDELANFLALAANAEPMGYPVLAKLYHQRLGTFASATSRAITYDVQERHWALEPVLDHIQQGTGAFRERIFQFQSQSGAA